MSMTINNMSYVIIQRNPYVVMESNPGRAVCATMVTSYPLRYLVLVSQTSVSLSIWKNAVKNALI